MSRLRRIDRLLLDESADDTLPLDSDDQDLLISLLLAENDGSYKLYTRILVLSVVAEFPAISFLLRKIVGKEVRYTIQFILLTLLCLIGSLYDISAVGTRVSHVSSVEWIPDHLIPGIFSFKLLCVVNGLLLLQFYAAICRLHGLQAKYVFLLLPLVNFVVMIMVRLWYTLTASDIRRLYDLRYKFKTA